MASAEIKVTGKVVKGVTSAGSKSEHDALHIETEKGSFLLRRKGGNPFNDTSLNKFAGKMITATGIINDYVFMATDVQEEKEDCA